MSKTKFLSAKERGITPAERKYLLLALKSLKKEVKEDKAQKIDGVSMSFDMTNYFGYDDNLDDNGQLVIKRGHTCKTAGCIAGYMFTHAYNEGEEHKLLPGAKVEGKNKVEKLRSLARQSREYGSNIVENHDWEEVDLEKLFHPDDTEIVTAQIAIDAIEHFLSVEEGEFNWYDVDSYVAAADASDAAFQASLDSDLT